MKQLLPTLATMLFALVGAVTLVLWWFAVGPGVSVDERVPLSEEVECTPQTEEPSVDLRGVFERFEGQPSPMPTASWPRFRGERFDNVCSNELPLLTEWPSNGPPVLWAVELGEGHAGPAVANGCVYLLDYDEKKEGDSLRCFSFEDGREIWRRTYRVKIKRNHGMSRTVPAVTERFVVTVGPKGHVLCCDSRTGDFKWGIDMVREWEAKIPLWYTAQCPLIDDGLAILAPCGKALLIAVDCESGTVVWKTPNPGGLEMSHSSIVPMHLGARKMYVYHALGGMVGVSAEGPDRGTILWQTREWTPKIVAPSPVVLEGGRILVTAGYGAGSAMFELNATNGTFAVRLLFTLDRTVFACEHHTPIYHNGYLYSVLPLDAGVFRQELVCMDTNGRVVWRSGTDDRFGLGPFLMCRDHMFVLRDDGILTLAHVTPGGYVRRARARVLTGRDAWAPMALVDGRLLLRDSTRLLCIDVRQR
ncbi:MAG: PQQ-binding-like beta-propeller repeat protein [Kiritimatiellae bacterium]|nr:PQQ-binding-like beta-propeller repeat protein [Kiritimatiellia bacterium]